ncbi:unnamed protein product [Gordionus sp. m RMFG-2023]
MFLYRIDHKKDLIIYYRCRNKNYKGRCKFDGTYSITCLHSQQHETYFYEKLRTKEVLEMVVAENPLETRLAIYEKAIKIRCSESLDIADYPETIPSCVSIKTTIDRIIKIYRPMLPHFVEDIHLTPEYTLTNRGEQFLLYTDSNKLIIFGTARMLRLAERADKIYMDGTFYSAHSLYYQLYVIHVLYHKVMIPIVYALLPNKNKETYTKVLRVLIKYCGDNNIWLSPSLAQTDFENVAISALNDVFPTMAIKGCYFHFSQALWRKCQTLGLSASYMGHSDIHKVVRRMSTIPFCRDEHVAIVRDTCYQMAANNTLLLSFMRYMDTTWLGVRPLFPYKIWSRCQVSFIFEMVDQITGQFVMELPIIDFIGILNSR